MILQNRAYAGEQYVYRAYHNNKIIWDHGNYANGVGIGSLDASAMPKPVDPTPIQLHAEATIAGTGKAHTMELISIQAHTDATIAAEGNPRAVQTIRSAGKAEADIQAVGAPSSFGQVFTTAHATAELAAQAMPRPVETAYGAGVAEASVIGSICPTVVEFLDLLASAGATIAGSATPQPQAPEQIIGSTAAELSAICGPVAVPVHTVTLMCNGEELYKTKVVHGYACPDPVEAGEIETPTQEATAQYTFKHSGWTLTEGGDADESALTNITADTVIYAAFERSVRYYTITYYDENTIFTTQSVAYGSMPPSFVPTKDDYAFDDWYPEIVPVTGDASYYAGWVGKISFSTADWATIAELSESGKASRHFAVGDTKPVDFNGTTLTVAIADFDHDDLADGSGKAGMTIVCKTVPNSKITWYPDSEGKFYNESNVCTTLASWVSYLPSELQSVLKSVTKKYETTFSSGNFPSTANLSCKLFPLTITELGFPSTAATNVWPLGSRYPLFTAKTSSTGGTKSEHVTIAGTTTYVSYWTPQLNRIGVCRPVYVYYRSGSYTWSSESSISSKQYYVRFAFCV